MDYRRKEKNSKQSKGGSWRGLGKLRGSDFGKFGDAIIDASNSGWLFGTSRKMFVFFNIFGNFIIPTDWPIIFQRGLGIPLTSANQNWSTSGQVGYIQVRGMELDDRRRLISHQQCFCCTGSILTK